MKPHYDATAEYHEVHMHAAWDRLRDLMTETFGGIDPDGVIVDIGAGSGMGTAMLAGITGAEIIALEPNDTMRAMLVARIDTIGQLERVTVVPEAVPGGLHRLPGRVDGVVATHMLGHLDAEAQARLFEWIVTSLTPGRSALLTVSSDTTQVSTEPIVEERQIGRYIYRTTHRMPGPGQYEGIFEVVDEHQQVVRSVDDTTAWNSTTIADVRDALVDHPVDVTEPLPGVALISRRKT